MSTPTVGDIHELRTVISQLEVRIEVLEETISEFKESFDQRVRDVIDEGRERQEADSSKDGL